MTSIDGGPAASVHDPSPLPHTALPDVWAAFEAEFVVDWQVADGVPLARPSTAGEANSL